MRAQIFSNNSAMAAAHNARPDSTFLMSTNSRFASLSVEEFAAYVRSGGFSSLPRAPVSRGAAPPVLDGAPSRALRADAVRRRDAPSVARQLQPAESVDWEAAGAVTPVKDQGACGCCWAFVTAASLESATFIASGGSLTQLSEQELVDCTNAVALPAPYGRYSNAGCGGGYQLPTSLWIKENGGLCGESHECRVGRPHCSGPRTRVSPLID